MLKSIDILIGLSLVMLVVSMAVTLVTQFLITLGQNRGRHLKRGLADLLEQLHPGVTREIAEELSGAVLKHPLIRGSQTRYGSVIRREELTKLLIGFAAVDQARAGGAAEPMQTETIVRMMGTRLSEAAQQALTRALSDNGIKDPQQTLANVRMLALQLEKTNPDLATTARQNLALMHEAGSEFVAKLNSWFDQTMDRVSERFTFSTRGLTFLSAALVACALQLDTVSLVNRLSMDDNMRNALVQQAVVVNQQEQARLAAAAGSGATAGAPADPAILRDYYAALAKAGILHVPGKDWVDEWKNVSLPGLIISILLLSLGAPFWYSALNKLLALRSVIAQKDDSDRKNRESNLPQGGPAGTGVQTAPAILAGERGDLAAIG